MSEQACAPNHHGHYPRFSGLLGLVAALSMVAGRGGDARLAARLSDLAAGDVVVDIGCGPGAAARHATKLGASVTGVDPAPVMLRMARILTAHSTEVRFLEGVAEALPVPDDSASVVWSIATVHHWVDLDAGLRETRRVVRAGGRFVAIERRTHAAARGLASHGWTDAQAAGFADLCRDHGFVGAEIGKHRNGRRSTVSVVAAKP